MLQWMIIREHMYDLVSFSFGQDLFYLSPGTFLIYFLPARRSGTNTPDKRADWTSCWKQGVWREGVETSEVERESLDAKT